MEVIVSGEKRRSFCYKEGRKWREFLCAIPGTKTITENRKQTFRFYFLHLCNYKYSIDFWKLWWQSYNWQRTTIHFEILLELWNKMVSSWYFWLDICSTSIRRTFKSYSQVTNKQATFITSTQCIYRSILSKLT